MSKILIMYSYSPKSKSQDIKIKNFHFFLDKAIIPSENYHYYFIISGYELNSDLENKLKMYEEKINNQYPNTFYIVKRDNKGYDFGAYSDIILNINNKGVENYTKYDYFFCINDSVRGPFFPHWQENKNWVNIFISLFSKDIKLVGPTLNYYNGTPHINSEFFVLDKIGLDISIKNNIFSKKYIENFEEVCNRCEVGQSTSILNAGYNIKCLNECYKKVDFNKYRGKKYASSSLMANFDMGGDPLFTNKFYGRNINIYEVIFIKANRNIDNYLIDKYTEWTVLGNKDFSKLD